MPDPLLILDDNLNELGREINLEQFENNNEQSITESGSVNVSGIVIKLVQYANNVLQLITEFGKINV